MARCRTPPRERRFAIEEGPIDFKLSLAALPVTLADGDRHRMNVSDPKTGETLVSFDDLGV